MPHSSLLLSHGHLYGEKERKKEEKKGDNCNHIGGCLRDSAIPVRMDGWKPSVSVLKDKEFFFPFFQAKKRINFFVLFDWARGRYVNVVHKHFLFKQKMKKKKRRIECLGFFFSSFLSPISMIGSSRPIKNVETNFGKGVCFHCNLLACVALPNYIGNGCKSHRLTYPPSFLSQTKHKKDLRHVRYV